jgi:hypothetical protein
MSEKPTSPYEPPSVEEIDTGDNSLSTCPAGTATLPTGAES